MGRHITISPITRLEGHGQIDIVLDDDGNVEDCFFQVVELRGFERFLQGRPAEELPRITPKICGVCPGAHHMASAKALDALFEVEPPPAGVELRRLFLDAHIAHSHLLHFFALGAPDFLPGPEAPKAERNVLGLIAAAGEDAGRLVLRARGHCQRIQGIIGGHPIHPVAAVPGGMSKPLSEAERDEILPWTAEIVAAARLGLDVFRQHVLGNDRYREMITGDTYRHETHYAGMVDDAGHVDLYDGQVRVIEPDGSELVRFDGADYLDHIGERVLPWSYLKFPYLKAKGWHGLTDGAASGVFRVNSLARLNVATGMATPGAQEAYDELYATLGEDPAHGTLAYHWARLVETLQCAERVHAAIRDPEITSPDVRVLPSATPRRGVGVVEAARGTLYHDYETDRNGIITAVNLIVATVQNNAAMGMSVKRAAEHLIKDGAVDDAILDQVEMAFRAYDPCLACATHALPGEMPMRVRLLRGGRVERTLAR